MVYNIECIMFTVLYTMYTVHCKFEVNGVK